MKPIRFNSKQEAVVVRVFEMLGNSIAFNTLSLKTAMLNIIT